MPNEDAIRNREVRDELIKAVNNLDFFYENKFYDLDWTSFGFEVTLTDDVTYIYVPYGNLLMKEGIEPIELLPGGDSILLFPNEKKYETILGLFQSTFADFPYDLNIYYSGEQSTISGLNEKISKKFFIFYDDSITRKRYGIDSSNNFYQFRSSNKDYPAISDWQEIPKEDIATNLELNLFNKKQELIEGCGNG